jgi:hypothetical protein
MDEDIDVGIETSVDTGVTDSVSVEPLADIPVEEAPIDTMDSLNEIEPPISEPEMAELQSEAEALAIEPLDEGVDLGFNNDEVIAEQEATDQPYEPSTLEAISTAAMSNLDSPGLPARAIGGLAPPGAKDALAQAAQMGMDATLPAAEGFMEAAHNQHALDYERPSFPREGVDFIRNENGEPEPIRPMVHTTDGNGESIWVRPENDMNGKQNDG